MQGDPFHPQAPLEGAAVVKMRDNEPSKVESTGDGWLHLARQAYEASTSWMEANVNAQWERNIANYRSEHPPGSRYLAESYKHRAKHFRPKSRALIRAMQAAAASAYFSSADVTDIRGEDESEPMQQAAAALMKEMVNYRLTQTVPWYKIVLGAIADVGVQGSVATRLDWEYDEENGVDRPKITPVPPENIRISPSSDWLDPVGTSPYLIELIPMYVADVLDKIEQGGNPKSGEPDWLSVGESALLGHGRNNDDDAVRLARDGRGRTDSKDGDEETIDEFRPVWIHRNIVRRNGKDWLYYTVGTTLMLSEPVPLAGVIPWARGERGYVLGCIEIEPNRPYPSAPVELSQGLQGLANEIVNQRIDNVRQVLNKRYIIRQGVGVDVRSLTRSVPGGVIGATDPERDIRVLDTPDVTASAYREQDLINVDMDELTGSFSGSSVQSNRQLNETVGGMNLMSQSANQVREMELRTFTETWMEPLLRLFVKLEAYYETDQVILIVAARKARLAVIFDEYFSQPLSVSVNVGMGATNPTQKMERFSLAVGTAAQLVPQAQAMLKPDEVIKEIFGNAGYQDGARFFNGLDGNGEFQPPPSPEQQAAQAEIEMKQAELQLKQQEMQMKMEWEQARIQIEREKMQAEMQLDRERMMMEMQLKREESALRAEQAERDAQRNAIIQSSRVAQQQESRSDA